MRDVQFKLLKTTDKDLIFRFRTVFDEFALGTRNVNVTLVAGGDLKLGSLADEGAEFVELLDQNSELIHHLAIQVYLPDGKQFNVSFNRDFNQYTDNINLQFSNLQDSHRSFANKLLASLRKAFGAADSKEVLERLPGDAMQARFEASERELNNLKGIANSLIYDQEKNRRNLEEQYDARKQKLDEDHEKRTSELKAREEHLEKRLRDVDDRESRHARRALRDKIQSTIEKRAEAFTLSKGTIKLRTPIFGLTVVLLALFGILFAISVVRSLTGSSEQVNVETIVRQVALAAAFGSTIVFYLRWNNKWFERHAEEEFMLKRQEIDIDRASWVVELASEWSDRGKELPGQLLSKLTTGLFEYEVKEVEPLHPIDQLATSILGSSAKAHVKLPNNLGEIELDRKSLKDLRQPLEV